MSDIGPRQDRKPGRTEKSGATTGDAPRKSPRAMPFEPKPASPTYSWLNLVTELQALLDPGDDRFDDVFALLWREDQELLTVSDFCVVQPGNPAALVISDFDDGTWLTKYKQAAAQAAFYRLCQDA